jgi:predicted  nucleic acid-binding Zn-ribbon protein
MAVETSVTEKLQLLWRLQQVDSQLDEIQVLKGELPMEVADLEDEVAGLDTRLKKIKQSIKEADGEISAMQSSSKEAEANIKRYQKQLDEVKNNREYEALQKEIELANLDIKLYEKRIKEVKLKIEGMKGSLEIADAKMEAKKKDLETKKVELQGIIEKTEKEEASLHEESARARRGIEERLLKAYSKIRSTYRNGLAVAPVMRNSCGGCFNYVPPQVQLEVGLHKKIIACEHCGRILVDHSISHVDAGTVEA